MGIWPCEAASANRRGSTSLSRSSIRDGRAVLAGIGLATAHFDGLDDAAEQREGGAAPPGPSTAQPMGRPKKIRCPCGSALRRAASVIPSPAPVGVTSYEPVVETWATRAPAGGGP